jgi:hypothetical protein
MTLGRNALRRVISAVGVAVTALSVLVLAPVPAHATLGPTIPINIQLSRYYNGGDYLVGKVVGTIQFDDGNTSYRLAVTVCRQSSYTSPNVRIFLNGVAGYIYSGEDGILRSAACGGGHGMSYVINGLFTEGIVVRFVGISIEGIHFDGSTATTVTGGAGWDNPYN